jgi:hypothetical protein
VSEEALIRADGREMCRFLAQLAEALDAAGRPTAQAFAEFYGHSGALGWVAGMLEEYAANPPIEIRLVPASALRAGVESTGASA